MRHPMYDPAMLPGAQLTDMTDFPNPDDRLLCCLMTEFSENMGLVADVYISTRRLEGIYYDLATTMDRIRKIAKVRASLREAPVRHLVVSCMHTSADNCTP
jgi:hypothetical protein